MDTKLLSLDKYVAALRQNGLVVSTELDRAVEEFHQAAGSDSIDDLGRFLIGKGLLTLWQHRRVCSGRARQCFLDKYKLLAPLGAQREGTTFLAVHTRMRRKVAIKLLPLKRDSGPDALEKFLTEAEAVARLDHENIIRAYEVDNQGDLFYLVMEYVEGKALSRIVADQGPLEFRTAAEYIRQAAAGLSHAHAAGIVHYDVRPGNLLLSSTGTVKVMELGVPRLGDSGKASFAAPELLAPDAVADARADVYSLGATLFFLLSGRPPFEGVRGDQPQPLSELCTDVPEPLERLCHWMMAADPDSRPKSAGRVSRLLAKWLAGEALEIPLPVTPEPASPPPTVVETVEPADAPRSGNREKLWWLSAIAVVLLLVALGAAVGKLSAQWW